MISFKQLGLSDRILEILNSIGFEEPTPIQQKAIPQLLQPETKDFIGLAQTGTGKTGAFGLPLIDLINADNNSVQALIMAPTRELGQQTAQQLTMFSGNYKKVNVEVVYGGAAISNQINALKRPTQIVVATPGRLLDLIRRKAISLKNIQYVVLDEADEMLNMGFKEDIDEILSHTPDSRNIWLFSATMPLDIKKIVDKFMTNPVEVSIDRGEKTNKDISHQYIVVKTSHKVPAMLRFLDLNPEMRGVMFCRTKRETQEIADAIANKGYGVEALHGDLSQKQRDSVMNRFKSRAMQLLIATDVAARGIDVNDLTHVFHHNIPDQPESYTHRSGRTARAGKKGISMALINPNEEFKVRNIEKKLKVSFEKVRIPTGTELITSRLDHWAKITSNINVNQKAKEVLNNIAPYFETLSKEELLLRLITKQLDDLHVEERNDLNEDASTKRKDRKERKEKEKSTRGDSRGKSSGNNRYFINLGTIDGVTSGDLVHFIAEIGNFNTSNISNLKLLKNCAYFDVDKGKDSNLGKKFEGIEIDGRAIRVNHDDDNFKREKTPSKGGYNRNRPKSKKSAPKGRKRFR